ncbi:hypothetical protein BH10PSE12_BH10PSE12_29780 [soil metagenome]
MLALLSLLILSGDGWEGDISGARLQGAARPFKDGRNGPTAKSLWIEAETAVIPPQSGWALVRDGDALNAMALRRDARLATGMAPLHFALQLDQPGRYYLYVRAKITGDVASSGTLRFGLNGSPAAQTCQIDGLGLGFRWNPGKTGTYCAIALNVAQGGTQDLTVAADHSGLMLDLLYLTRDPAARPGFRQARTTASFLGSLGINTHLSYADTAYGDFARVVAALQYLGIRNIRDGFSQIPDVQRRIDHLGAQGYKFDFFIISQDPLAVQLAGLRPRRAMITSIEGPNEIDNWPVRHNGLTGFPAARAMMKDLSAAVRQQPGTQPDRNAIAVIQTSFGKSESYARMGSLAAFVDFGNAHTYFQWGAPPGSSLSHRVKEAQIVSPGLPVISTEAGYHNAVSDQAWNSGLSEAVHGKYIPRLLLEQYLSGVSKTYLYELMDIAADPERRDPSLNFGLFHADGSPKPAATAIHNMVAALTERASDFEPGSLDYELVGAPATVHDLLLQKSDGTFFIVLWNDLPNWDHLSARAIVQQPAVVQIRLTTPVGAIRRFDVQTATASPLARNTTGNLTVSIPDHPVILELSPNPMR